VRIIDVQWLNRAVSRVYAAPAPMFLSMQEQAYPAPQPVPYANYNSAPAGQYYRYTPATIALEQGLTTIDVVIALEQGLTTIGLFI